MSYKGFEEGVTYFIGSEHNMSCEAVYITVIHNSRHRLFFDNNGEVIYLLDYSVYNKEDFWKESDVDYFKVLGVIL